MPTLWPSVKMYRLLICCLAWAIIGNIYITGQIMSDTPLDRTSQVLNTLMSLYDKRIRPHTNGSATEVTCNMYIISLDSVKEATMEYGMTILFTQKWVDSRLAFNVSILNGIDKITIAHDVCWVPDLYFTNVKEGSFHQVTVENRFIETNHLGHVTLSMKLTLILSCYMDFRRFPMDQQECGMDIESYQYGSDNLVVKWRDENPIRKKPDVRLPQFSISPMITRNCSHDMYETDPWSSIPAFGRNRGYFYREETRYKEPV
uniref:Glycine receptor subunit alpha-3-like n=1 Tax=Saccoglossus kowalevskii TaxID=10224 RepID=A0ABM0M273_SACKO|nr:PREDICTED: glycine receptor subunit alpha-3-like [Saccoglossus kowalevskii]